MDINRMRLGLVYIFAENEKLSKESKIQLINFIESANEYQLKALALDGEIIITDKLDEQAISILNARFIAESDVYDKIKGASLLAVKALTERETGQYASSGATLGALAGLFTPFPFGSLGGALVGAGIGALLGKWTENNRQKVEAYCGKHYEPNSKEYKHCTSLGSQAIKQKVGEVKAKVKQIKAAKAKNESLDLDSMLKELDQEKFNTGVKVGATVGAAALAARHMMKRRKEKAALKAQQMQQAKMAQK